MTARRIVIAALMLVLTAAGAENAGNGVGGAADASPARAASVRRFLDGFWVTITAEEPAPEVSPAAAPNNPALVQVPIQPPPAPTLQLCSVPTWRRWHLPRWSWCAAVAMLAVAAAFALAGALRGIWLELRHPRRLRQLAAVKALRSWRITPTPPFAGLLQAFREFYGLPAGCDADAIAAVVGKTDADLAQAILAMDCRRFAPANSSAGESAANASAEASAVCTPAGGGAASPPPVAPAASAEAGTVPPVHPVFALLSRWLRHRPQRVPGRGAAVVAAALAVAAVLSLVVVVAAASDLTQPHGYVPAWNRALQHVTEQDYARAFDAFLALERVSPSSPELSRNLAVLAAATGRAEAARAWRRHALIQEQPRGRIRLVGRDWRWPVAVPALLLATAFVGFCVAAMGWPGAWRRALAWRAWLLLPLALFACSALLLGGHWRQCRRLQEQAVVAKAQPLFVTPGETTVAQALVARTDMAPGQAAIGQGATVGMATATALTQLAAGDGVGLRQARGEWCFVSVNGTTGWLPHSGILPFRL